jgi:integrase
VNLREVLPHHRLDEGCHVHGAKSLPVAAPLLFAEENPTWRTIIALARFGGLRCPSEVLSLEWRHIDWERNRITVPSPKTDRYDGKACRTIPLFADLRPFLEEAFELAAAGQSHVIGGDHLAKANGPTGWKNCNLRTAFDRLVKRAG